jgi:flavin-dependent dehydrogenase
LAGDATGHLHPLSGVGITLGLLDAVEAARAPSFAAYQKERAVRVVELLSSALYLAFARHDASAVRVRRGVFRMLRSNPRERYRTMRLLTGADRSGTSFASAFLRATGSVVASGVERTATRRQSVSDLGQQMRQDAVWLKWPLDACVPLARLREHTLGSNGEASLPRRSLQQ